MPGAGVSPSEPVLPCGTAPLSPDPPQPPSHVNHGPGGSVLFPWLDGERFCVETSRITAEGLGSPGLERFSARGRARAAPRGESARGLRFDMARQLTLHSDSTQKEMVLGLFLKKKPQTKHENTKQNNNIGGERLVWAHCKLLEERSLRSRMPNKLNFLEKFLHRR